MHRPSSIAAALAVSATLALAAPAAAEFVYQSGTETGARYNPGSDQTTVYMNVFVANNGQSQLDLAQVQVGIRRLVAGGFLTAVGVELFAARMTYDSGAATYGADVAGQVSLGSFELGADAAAGAVTQIVSASGLNQIIDLETGAQAGFGGFWVGLRFTGPNAANNANGWRVVNVPTIGASINGFGQFNANGSGVFDSFFVFGDPAAPLPSRFLVNVEGALVPAPGALALLTLVGAVGRRRRR
jgi:MYXO-CTERM domain-containing protein